MAKRVFVKPEAVSPQLELPTNRSARAHNRQLEELKAGRKIRRKPGRPKKLTPSAHAISHRKRPGLRNKEVLHLTLKLRRGLQSLRRGKTFEAIKRSFYKYSRREGFRLIHFSVQHDHLHLIAEADSKTPHASDAAPHGLTARQLNFVWQKISGKWTGRVFKERYHNWHLIRNPNEVRAALLYVLRNSK